MVSGNASIIILNPLKPDIRAATINIEFSANVGFAIDRDMTL